MALNRSRILILILICVIVTVAFVFASRNQNPGKEAVKTVSEPQAWASPDPTPNDARDYKNLTARLENERVALTVRYQQAASSVEQANVLDQARTSVTRSIYAEIFPSWYGTAWDFNGTTEVPQQGKIACGYFVSTVLGDAGWRVQRARLAQQASENIILSLTTEAYVKRFRRVAIRDFVDAVKNWGTGIYVVGLDIHTPVS